MTPCLKRISDSVCDTDVAAGQNLPLTRRPTSPPQNLIHRIVWVVLEENDCRSFHRSCFSQLKGWCLDPKGFGLFFWVDWIDPNDVELFWEG